MNSQERKATVVLASVMSLRMLGLFLVLPVFSLYAMKLQNATPFLMWTGYGNLWINAGDVADPLWTLVRPIGRKPVILLGLSLFILGSFIAAYATSIEWMVVGRALQGGGAVGSALMALLADVTRTASAPRPWLLWA